MNTPKVSVVMSVYNDAHSLKTTTESILNQRAVDFEFIIVNDGADDHCLDILQSIAQQDTRIVLINQENQGLTKAIINGCNRARGQFIARQDNGDMSMQGRLKHQLRCFEQHPNTSMVSCGARFVAPTGEELYSEIQSDIDARTGLKQTTVNTLKGPPHHGGVMFRRDAYEQVGGYREQFIVAQDIDLWTRLVEIGDHRSLQGIYYQAIVAKNSISMLKRDAQLEATQAIIDCAHARSQHSDDSQILTNYVANRRNTHTVSPSKTTDSAYYYFLGSNLSDKDTRASAHYLSLATTHNPLHWKAWIKRTIVYSKIILDGILKK